MAKKNRRVKRRQDEEFLDWVLAIDFLKCEDVKFVIH
jgi:hypothetical protein